jgi:two-component system cell cycle sensor histidine kinase/response regulator CckA
MREIAIAADRAANLTRQLLAFSRRQVMRPRVLQLNEFVEVVIAMLQSALGERYQLRMRLGSGLHPIWADESSLEQVMMHLALNARDAMSGGGDIIITTAEVSVDEEAATQHPEARPGTFVRLSVSDSGTGIDDATRAHIFEPFFTTKEVNKGSGMGLATVYGITKQHDGWIEVITAPGEGSTFSVYFPLTDRVAETPVAVTTLPVHSGNAHTILLVEDDDAVRELVKEILEYHEYRVLEADSADAAMLVWEAYADEIELLLTDMVMPGSANGLELSRWLLARRPELKVIYSSGYSADLFGSDVQLREGVNYLPKPYLTNKLTAILARAFAPAESSTAE